ncbi:arginine/serine-rich coiled-coil protein 2-like isoform X2 [Asparagus officinalis]|uniref:arginine/serine-rich coiled-coil protein 2-like isoform X2 n=1 Tax=Asparagus officinalis TaxID=4686 RepID=UPI00098E157D|nr:arginine/serine-rich coiled-coil protein 2-like isoform X2 [Asparagus officinalis]
MGKNQAYKAMQRSRLGSAAGGPEEIEDGMTDGSFHSPEWHAARLASLNTSHTITWEEYKKKQKEDELKRGEMEADKDKMMREYRAQLDAERARKLSLGRNHSSSKSHSKKERKDKDTKKRSSRKRKNLLAAAMMKGNQKGQDRSQDQRNLLAAATMRRNRKGQGQSRDRKNQRRKESTGHEPSTPAVTVIVMVPCHSPDSLAL